MSWQSDQDEVDAVIIFNECLVKALQVEVYQ